MCVRITVPTREVPDTADELVTDPAWLAKCDQIRAALRRTCLPAYGGSVRDELAAARWEVR